MIGLAPRKTTAATMDREAQVTLGTKKIGEKGVRSIMKTTMMMEIVVTIDKTLPQG
jgi:hypothetical protein